MFAVSQPLILSAFAHSFLFSKECSWMQNTAYQREKKMKTMKNILCLCVLICFSNITMCETCVRQKGNWVIRATGLQWSTLSTFSSFLYLALRPGYIKGWWIDTFPSGQVGMERSIPLKVSERENHTCTPGNDFLMMKLLKPNANYVITSLPVSANCHFSCIQRLIFSNSRY